jgi:hypothetical protein
MYVGVFAPGNDGHALWMSDRRDGFTKKWQPLSAHGLRLVDIDS